MTGIITTWKAADQDGYDGGFCASDGTKAEKDEGYSAIDGTRTSRGATRVQALKQWHDDKVKRDEDHN